MTRFSSMLCASIAVVLVSACTESPTRLDLEPQLDLATCAPEDLYCESDVSDACAVATVEWDDNHGRPGTLTVGSEQTITGVGRYDNGGLVALNFCEISWTTSDGTVLSVSPGATTSNLTRSATVGALNPGTATVTLTVTNMLGTISQSASRSYTVPVPPTPTPSVGTISGPTTVSMQGAYTFSVTAAGGDGVNYIFGWQKSIDGGVTWTDAVPHAGGATGSSVVISIFAGGITHLRVRAKSGTSDWSTYSPVHAVDATRAAVPLEVLIDGYDNIRSVGTHYFEAMPSNGTGTYSYLWSFESPGGSTVQSTNKVFSWTFGACDGEEGFNLSVTVTSGTETASASTILDVQYPDQC